MVGTTCDVCAREGAVGVASSSLGPISLAFCPRCLVNRAQPLWLLDATVYMNDGIDNCADWIKETITYTKGGTYRKYWEVWMGYSKSKRANVLAEGK